MKLTTTILAIAIAAPAFAGAPETSLRPVARADIKQQECLKPIPNSNAFTRTYGDLCHDPDYSHASSGSQSDIDSNGSGFGGDQRTGAGGSQAGGPSGGGAAGGGDDGGGGAAGDDSSGGSGVGDTGKGNASANNGRGGNYDRTSHSDNGKGNGRGRP